MVAAKRKQTRSAKLKNAIFGRNASIIMGNVFMGSTANGGVPASVRVQLEQKEKDDCRKSLGFSDINARVNNISPTEKGTCDWIFEMPQFQKWYSLEYSDEKLFWIKGKPGTGKSTMMKRILENCQTKEEYAIAAYFFNARGNTLEKTPLGMLRSLLFQIIAHEPILYDHLLPMFRKKKEENNSEDWEWDEKELRSFFLEKLLNYQTKPILLIIDALDECGEQDVQNTAPFLQQLSDKARIPLNICLSSRHYPSVSLERCQELILEKEKKHNEDITAYIRSHLKVKDNRLEKKIRRKASGIFMWVLLVITMLHQAENDGRVEAMHQKLNEIPADLEEVFETLLTRENPNKDETILILQWVLFAKRLLTPQEIYFALVAGTNPQRLRPWNPSEITPDVIRQRITSSSRGLIEIRKGVNETVQFIHGSVNDFLVRKNRLQILDSTLMTDPVAKSHDRLKDCCVSYIMMKSLKLPKNRQDARDIRSRYPFLQYASSYLFDHAEGATSTGQAQFMENLKGAKFWKRVECLHNFSWNYPGCGRQLSLLHILAARGLHKLVVILLKEGIDINAEGRPYGTALEAAIRNQREKTVETLLNKGAKIDARGRLAHNTALQKAIDADNKDILDALIDKGAKINIWERLRHGSVLRAMIKNGNRDAVAMLIDKGAKVHSKGLRRTALQLAASEGEKEIMEMLLEKGTNIHTRGVAGTALHMATINEEREIMKILLKKGAKVNTRGFQGTALQIAAANGNQEMVELLLDKGASINAWGSLGTALQAAALSGKKEIVEMLLEKGADVNAWGLLGSALQGAALSGKKEIVEILLKKGAEVNARGLLGTALQTAAFSGKKEIVEMLLENGAEVNARGLLGTALQAAAASGQKEIIELLIDKGAKVNTRGFLSGMLQGKGTKTILEVLRENLFSGVDYEDTLGAETKKEVVEILVGKGAQIKAWKGFLNTAFQVAISHGDKEFVEMLLKAGVKVNNWRGYQSAALYLAAYEGQKEMVELLLEKGANINAWAGLEGTALQAAAFMGEKEIVELLLNKGANINARGGVRGTALQAAALGGEKEIVELLLERGAKINAWGAVRGTALQTAIFEGDKSIVEILVKNGAKEPKWKGIYPLYHFLFRGSPDWDISEDEDQDDSDCSSASDSSGNYTDSGSGDESGDESGGESDGESDDEDGAGDEVGFRYSSESDEDYDDDSSQTLA